MARLSQLIAAAAALTAGVAAAGDDAVLSSEVGRLNNQSLLWGPYKPNLYFGVRPRLPEGLWSTLMWSRMDGYEDVKDGFRLTCEQGEEMRGYGWDEYDARTGGVQTIHDEGNKLDLTTSFVKVPGGSHGGSWAVRIKGELRDGAPEDQKTTVYYYFAQDGEGDLQVEGAGTEFGFEGDVALKGNSKSLGDYSILVTKGKGKHPSVDHDLSTKRHGDTTVVGSLQYADNLLWQAKPILFQQLQKAAQYVQETYGDAAAPPPWQVYRVDHDPGQGNVHIIQKTFEGPFEFDVIFSSGSAGKALTSEELTHEIKRTSESFSQRFGKVFDLKAPFKADKYLALGKSMFSNLLGGVGYFYGEQLIDRSYAPEYDEDNENFWVDAAEARGRRAQKMEGPYELFTSIPSRPFFPRGFLWDEGFHLVPIADWDMDLTLEIIKSWYKTMDDDGWIPREQILGAEARSKVPEEFQVQYPHYANPPTLFLVIEGFMERLRKANGTQRAEKETLSQDETLYRAHLDNVELGEEYLRKLYPLLRRQYDWFRKTQKGDIKSYDREAFSTKEAYRWRGRTETHCLTSGLDDYPRPQPPHPGELHVDLMSWVGLMTKSLLNIADALGMAEEVAELERNLEAIRRNLQDLHWSEKEGCFCDATIDEFEEHKLVCHKGYVSLFPFLVGLLKPDDPKLGKTLELLGDESHLFSAHGIRSLSQQDEGYGAGENYWRSPVWMPMNYMAVTQLYNVATQKGPFQDKARDLYTRLRRNLVETVYKSWAETGFAWEQYNPETGAGQRTKHFTGWTSLVVKLMSMEDLAGGHGRDEL
ncbi:Mannosyl-oligosaccharide glucosidase [Purpureocillium takamizusanense]|uniref:Mannosyl-oligosaccharide glucosidase n=1 Tax=Purpureocillium takamizusanense TaxID=2060973 RepID=A0A9Q8V9U4_9HYPO|nr:Mannosyl-oligosaccharide glucosidase [Purpureocillium takamizusanense]UNI18650.1 Mannosyl-oligosaccharide glucosidase [Purpureocillium takamizusanense]